MRAGSQTVEDLGLLNTKLVDCSRITFKDGLHTITPLNRNRWSLNMAAVVDWARFRRRHISVFISTHSWRGRALSPQEVAQAIEYGDNSNCKIPGVFFYAQGMPVVLNKNAYICLKVVNGAEFTAAEVISDITHTLDPANSSYRFLLGKCSRRGLPVVPAFVLIDYKAQGKTFADVLLKLRGNRTTNGQPSKCDFTSLYVQLSRCRTLQGMVL